MVVMQPARLGAGTGLASMGFTVDTGVTLLGVASTHAGCCASSFHKQAS